MQVVAARQVLRGTVEDLIREMREREAAGKAHGAGSHADGTCSNGASGGAASAASKDPAKVLALIGEEVSGVMLACRCLRPSVACRVASKPRTADVLL